MADRLEIIILAAGAGSRMRSDKPKVLHELAGRSLLERVLDTARRLNPTTIHVVVGHQGAAVRNTLDHVEGINWVEQVDQNGTGHAVMQALPFCAPDARVLVLYGDVPLIRAESLLRLTSALSSLALLTVVLENPAGYGRILRNESGCVTGIVEDRDATQDEQRITEINTGIMCAPVNELARWLGKVGNDNSQAEFYLTDIVAAAVADGVDPMVTQTEEPAEVSGVNDQVQLAELERYHQRQNALTLMRAGTRILDPNRFDLRGDIEVGRDVVIDINAIFEGHVVLGDGVIIGPNCWIKNSTIGAGTNIHPNSVIEGALIGKECSIGPFARIRKDTRLMDQVRIGNFVETKNAHLGEGTKASHLSYLGDATIGTNTNIGAGTITCNYDGINKHHTHIGSNSFIGSNTALVAPVSIADQTHIGAGSTITKDVPAEALAVARGRQRNIEGWKARPK